MIITDEQRLQSEKETHCMWCKIDFETKRLVETAFNLNLPEI